MLYEVEWLTPMQQQTTFLDGQDLTTPVVARARKSDPETSHQAAAEVEATGAASAHRSIIVAYLKQHPGETNAEIAEGSGLDYCQIHKRMAELERMNLVIRGQQKKCPIHQRQMLCWFPK